MPIRDLGLFLFIFAMVPAVFVRPYIGILLWVWLGYMNPHKLSWGAAQNFQFQMMIALITIVAWLMSREPKQIRMTPLSILLLLFVLWMSFTTLFALSDEALEKWTTMLKIVLLCYLILAMVNTRERLDALIWVIVASLGFFGVKGGIFVILSGGQYLVWGPPESFIGANNAIGLALLMIMPLMRYLQLRAKKTWVQFGLLGAMFLSAFAVVGTYSRGAFLTGVAMVVFLIIKSRRRALFGGVLVMIALLSVAFMPGVWVDRMQSISSYEEDKSAQGRFDAWAFAAHMATIRPLTGGGFGVIGDWQIWRQHWSIETTPRSAHSIYFEVLGEHGFIGLFLFLAIGITAWRTCSLTAKRAALVPEITWISDLARLLQVSMVSFAVGGLFLNKALFDLAYMYLAIVVIMDQMVKIHEPKVPEIAAEPDEPEAAKLAATLGAPRRSGLGT